MATIYNSADDPNDPNKQANAQETTNNLIQSTIAPTASGQAASPKVKGAPTSSGLYVDRGKYYEANKDAASGLQQGIVSGLQQKGDAANAALHQSERNYAAGLQTNQLTNNVFSGKTAADVNQSDFSRIFNATPAAGYNPGASADAVTNLGNTIQNINTEAGKREALRTLAAPNQRYTTGAQALDSYILGQAEKNTGALSKLRNDFGKNWAEAQVSNVQEAANAARNQANANTQAVQNAARQWLQGEGSAIQELASQSAAANTAKALQAAQARREQIYRDAGVALPSESIGNISAEASLTPDQARRLQVYNALKALGGAGQNINLGKNQDYTDAADQQRAQALYQARINEQLMAQQAPNQAPGLGAGQYSGIGGYVNPTAQTQTFTPIPLEYKSTPRGGKEPILHGKYGARGEPLDEQAKYEQRQYHEDFKVR